MCEHLLSVDDLEPLLHFAALRAPALIVGDQRDVRMLGDAVVAGAAVDAPLIIIAQVFIAAQKTTAVLPLSLCDCFTAILFYCLK